MGFDLGHLMKVRLTSLGNEDDDLNLTMRKEKRGEAQCLKIVQKVAFNIVSEASYVYISSGQKLIKKAKKVNFCERYQTGHKN